MLLINIAVSVDSKLKITRRSGFLQLTDWIKQFFASDGRSSKSIWHQILWQLTRVLYCVYFHSKYCVWIGFGTTELCNKMSQPFVLYRPSTTSASSSTEDATSTAATVQPVSSQHEHLLTEIESSEGNLAGVLRWVSWHSKNCPHSARQTAMKTHAYTSLVRSLLAADQRYTAHVRVCSLYRVILSGLNHLQWSVYVVTLLRIFSCTQSLYVMYLHYNVYSSLLRPLYDSHEAEGNIMSSLEARIKAHEKTIEGMCNKHYRWAARSVG